MDELDSKKEWYVYYSENCSQKRFVFFEKNTINALVISMRILVDFLEVYEDLLEFDGQGRLIDIENAISIFRDYQNDTEFSGCWLLINYNTAFMFIDALVVAKRIISNINQCFTTRTLIENIQSAIDLFDIKYWEKDIDPDNLPSNILI